LSVVIRELREERGLTQQAVAKHAKVTKNYITMLERGQRKNPSLPILRRIAAALGVEVGRLLD
jgi:transcriptional regulator with XRE-family HTH domain